MIERTAPDLVVPLDIETVVRLAELEHLGADLLALHDPAVAEQIHDRLALADLVESASRHAHDLLCPPTTTLDRARWHRRGVFATPRFGASEGRGVVLRSEQALDRLRQQVRGPAYVAQPCCTPPTVTVDVFRSRDGGVVRAACRQRLDVGTDLGSDWRQARVFDDDELALQCGELLERLGLTGLLSLRLMRGPAEQWCLTNLAPAPSAGAPFARAAGVDLYSLFVADRLGLDPDPGWAPPLDGDRTVARRFVEHVTLATPPVGPTAADPPGTAAEQA